MRTAASKLPMKWLTLAATALFLAATALFGGLAEAPPRSVPTLQLGESFERANLTLAVQGAGLADAEWADPDDPERQLFIDIAVTNLGESFMASTSDGALGGVGVVGHEELEFPRMTRPGESRNAILQPLVPTTVRIVWEVPREAFTAGETIQVVLPNATSRRMFTQSALLWDLTPGAHVAVVLDDIGAAQ